MSDPAEVASAIALVLAIPELPTQSVESGVIAWARERRPLLILDNCEQVVDGVATLADKLLHTAPALQLLATSRVPLRIAAEHEYLVAPAETATLRRP